MLVENNKINGVSKTVTSIIFISLCLNNVNPTFGFEVSPVSLAILFIAFILSIKKILSVEHINIFIFIVVVSLFASCMFISLMDFAKDSIFFITLFVGMFVGNHPSKNLLVIRYFAIVLAIFALLQLIPNYIQFHEIMFGRSSTGTGRGLTSILSEPSFLAACTSIMLLNYCLLKGKIYVTDPTIILLILCLLSTLSTMAIFGLLLVSWKSNFSIRVKLALLLFLVLILWPIITDLNIRLVHVIFNLIQGHPLDGSASSRLFYIKKDLQIARDTLFLPIWGIGGYSHAVENMMNTQVPKNFLYNPNLSGSLLGRYIVCFGILLFIVPLLFLHKSSKRKFVALCSYLGFICLLTMQMIPTSLITVNLFVGSSLTALYKLSRGH